MLFTERTVLASVLRDSFWDFVQEFWPVIVSEPMQKNWHLEVFCSELQTVAERVFAGKPKEYDLLFNVPPGTSKSTIVSQMFPAYCWTIDGTLKFICGSYSHPIALKDSIRMRDVVMSELYQELFPNIQLREDANTKGMFQTLEGGYRYSVGVSGSVTGYHGHFLMVDDPLDPEGAHSDLELRRVNRWMNTTLPTRKVDKKMSVTVLVQQRLHQGDPSGEMLDQAKKGRAVRHICLPGELVPEAAVSPPELRARYIDGLLDPGRLSRPVLQELETLLGAYGYAAQVIQRPVPLGGGMFEVSKIRKYDVPPARIVRKIRDWDKAGTEGGGAYTAGVLICVDSHGDYGILDVKRGQWGAAKREETILETAEEDGVETEVLLEIEGGSGGKESGENTVRNLAGFRVFAFHPTGSKEARAEPFASQVGANRVWCLNRPWTKEYLEELEFFPHSKYKDQVDATSGGFNRLAAAKRKVGVLFSSTPERRT